MKNEKNYKIERFDGDPTLFIRWSFIQSNY